MSSSRSQWWVMATIGVVGLVAAVGITTILVLRRQANASAGGTGPSAMTTKAAANVDIDPGSPAGNAPAPGFTLRDQQGRRTSLSQFRGKVIVLAFVDSHCTTICPLTTQSMVEALRLLGPAAAQVQLLGINANPLATRVADVAAYTRAHQMEDRWRFLTGSLAQLKRVWRGYHVYVAAIHNDIDHQPIMVLIDRQGRERRVYLTQMSYEGVDQQAQLLADGIARLLPGHPAVRQEFSLRYVPPDEPTKTVRVSAVGSSRRMVVLGGTHAHLLLFFAGWLGEKSNLSAELVILDRYASMARREGWPPPVAIDEMPTEISAAGAQHLLRSTAASLHVPVAEDVDGRLADGYRVEDLPWFVLSSESGRTLWHHDGWLSEAALDHDVRSTLATH